MKKKEELFFQNQEKLLMQVYPNLTKKELREILSFRIDFWKKIIEDYNTLVIV